MHTFVKRALWGAALAGGITFLGATAAGAAETGGEEGILSGTQILAPLTAPVTVVGNAISVLGGSAVETPAPAPAPSPAAEPAPAPATTDGTEGIASGSQAAVPVTVPITVSGNAISVLGESASSGSDPAPAETAPAATPAPAPAPAPEGTTSGGGGILSGTQGLVAVEIPVTIGGNAISVLGESAADGSATGATPAAPGSGGEAVTDGGDSVLGGSQLTAPVTVPVSVQGNAISLLGESSVTGGGTAAAPAASGPALPAQLTSGPGSLLGGTQLALPISLPITIGGNSIGILGESTVSGPGTVPTTDPGPIPGTDPGPIPGVDPGPLPTADPGAVPGVLPAATGAGVAVLATTGGAGGSPLALAALLLIGAAALLLRRGAARGA